MRHTHLRKQWALWQLFSTFWFVWKKVFDRFIQYIINFKLLRLPSIATQLKLTLRGLHGLVLINYTIFLDRNAAGFSLKCFWNDWVSLSFFFERVSTRTNKFPLCRSISTKSKILKSFQGLLFLHYEKFI